MTTLAAIARLQVVDSLAQGLARIPKVPALGTSVQAKLIETALIALALMVLRQVVLRAVDRNVEDQSLRYRWSKATGYVSFVLGVLLIVPVWVTQDLHLSTFLGLVSAGVAIALKDLLADLAGWIFILWRRPFDLGDRIQIGDHAGDVVDRRIFAITIMEIGNWVDADQTTGRMVHVPNSMVFTQPVANYTATFPFLWNEIPVLVTFESNWRKAKSILEEIVNTQALETSRAAERQLRQAAQRYYIYYSKLTPIVYTSVEDSGVLLTARYLTDPRQRRGTAEAIWEAVLDAFAEAPDVDLAYPTQRAFLNPLEGKAGARAPWPPLSTQGDNT